MSTNNHDYVVEIEKFAQKHYIKKFRKKFKKAWEITETAIVQEVERIDRVAGLTDKIEKIALSGDYWLIKLYFSVAGTKKSAKASGNRAIILVDNSSYKCRILLVYSKNEICPPNETQKWMKVIKSNYPSIWKIFHRN